MQSGTIKELFEMMGYDTQKMTLNKFYSVSGYEILSWDGSKEVFSPITKIVRKESADAVKVNSSAGTLMCSADHRILSLLGSKEPPKFRHVSDLIGMPFSALSQDGWVDATAIFVGSKTEILDLEVANTHCYFADGVLSHNTTHGDPTVTPGGNALPYYASVRIRLQGGQMLRVDKNDAKSDAYGINVEAKLIKNRMTAPHRRANFQIHFGKGVFDHEELFDLCREWCDAHSKAPFMHEGKSVAIHGTSGNKYLTVSDPETGIVVLEKAFYKSKFGEVRKNPQFKKWIDPLVENVLTKKVVPVEPDAEDLQDINEQEDNDNA